MVQQCNTSPCMVINKFNIIAVKVCWRIYTYILPTEMPCLVTNRDALSSYQQRCSVQLPTKMLCLVTNRDALSKLCKSAQTAQAPTRDHISPTTGSRFITYSCPQHHLLLPTTPPTPAHNTTYTCSQHLPISHTPAHTTYSCLQHHLHLPTTLPTPAHNTT